jgi:predicted DNA-binding antitoxin AbrB/MazE fold protein
MTIQLEAVFENGVFRPLESVQLPEHQRVTVTIATDTPAVDVAHFTLSAERWQAFCDALDAPPRDIPALRHLLTEGSLFDDHGNAAAPADPAR